MSGGSVAVSHETFAQPASDKHRSYWSPHRKRQAEKTRSDLVKGALMMVAAGNFRPMAEEVARRCGMNKSVVVRYFGGIAELHAVIAQEHPDKVLIALGIEPLAGDAFVRQLAIVRAVMTGWRDARS